MTRLHATTGKTNLQRAMGHPTLRVARDLASDWKRWSLAERIAAAAIIPLAGLTVLAMSALASGGH